MIFKPSDVETEMNEVQVSSIKERNETENTAEIIVQEKTFIPFSHSKLQKYCCSQKKCPPTSWAKTVYLAIKTNHMSGSMIFMLTLEY